MNNKYKNLRNLFTFSLILLVFVSILFVSSPLVFADNLPSSKGADGTLTESFWWGLSNQINSWLAGALGDGVHSILMPLVHISGGLLDQAMAFSLNLGGNAYNTTDGGIIIIGWSIFRDIVNMLFIFIVIYLGVKIILGLSSNQNKSTLIRLVIFGLLINFSLVISGVIVDASNILAFGIYQKFPDGITCQELSADKITDYNTRTRGLSCPFMGAIDIQKFTSPQIYAAYQAAQDVGAIETGTSNYSFAIFQSVGAIAMIFTMGVGGVLLLIRTVVIIFLMIMAPLGIASFILPETKKYGDQWLHKLLEYAFFAPLFILLFYIAARFYGSSFLDSAFTTTGTVQGFQFSTMTFIVNLIVVTIFMLAALIISKKVGIYGARTVINTSQKWGKRAAGSARGAARGAGGFAGINTIGRGASAIRDSNTFKRTAARVPGIGYTLDRGLGAFATAGYGGGKFTKGGYDRARKATVKAKVDLGRRSEKGKRGEVLLARNWDGEILRDSSGHAITNKQRYINNLDREHSIRKWYKSHGLQQSRTDREAAQELTKKTTFRDEVRKIIEEEEGEKTPPTPGTGP